MKKAVLISCFNYYDNRLKFVEKMLLEKNYKVDYLYADFDHIKKEKISVSNKLNSTILKVPQYTKNFSINRIISHLVFSKRVYEFLNSNSPDLIYCMIPPNFLSYYVGKYKKKYNKTKLIFDIYDLWPESFPLKKENKLLNILIRPWGLLRDKNINKADMIITECDYYQKILKLDESIEINTLHLMKTESKEEEQKINKKIMIKQIEHTPEKIEIAYLGSINNIIDIENITLFLKKLNDKKRVKVNIIGTGENKSYFLSKLTQANVEWIDHGIVYDFDKKRQILQSSYFGINMMKNTVTVGLTMKSIEYFQFGLPLLNNIKGDSQKLILKEKVGFNLIKENFEEISKEISNLSYSELINMKKQSRKVYEDYFSKKAFNIKLRKIITDLKI